mgnify:CR=1 FL=1
MARIAGIDLPRNKRGEIGLTYIYGIGRSKAQEILNTVGVDVNIKVQDWTDEQLQLIRDFITGNMKVEGELRSEIEKYCEKVDFKLSNLFVIDDFENAGLGLESGPASDTGIFKVGLSEGAFKYKDERRRTASRDCLQLRKHRSGRRKIKRGAYCD